MCCHAEETELEIAGNGDEDDLAGATLEQAEGGVQAASAKRSHKLSMGVEVLKQFMASAGLLQELQQTFLFGDWITAKLTAIATVKTDFRTRKGKENEGRMEQREDMAKREDSLVQFTSSLESHDDQRYRCKLLQNSRGRAPCFQICTCAATSPCGEPYASC